MNERSIFLHALELTNPQERAKYLDHACGDDQALRGQVEELLYSHHQASSFLESPPEGLGATIACATEDTVGESQADDSLEFLTPSDKSGCLGALAQYEVVEVIGRGGMGLVLRAYDTKLSRVVAIKVMAPELAANPMAVKRFLREARAAAAVSHDHVVTIYAIEEDRRPPYIVMEFVDGQSIQEKIDSNGALELKEILRIGMQMAHGLAAAHQQGLVHRDIKPANILLENGVERVKITDFGLARAVDDVSVTQTGQIAGTPQFMSPEQAQGHAIDARSDLFSLGSVLYTMCTGRPPFRADSAVAMLRRVTDDDPRSIREINSEIPDWLEAIILKLMAKDPNDRFQSAEEVATLFGQHLAHRQNPTTTPKPAATVLPRKKFVAAHQRIATALACLLIAVFAIGAGAFFVTDRGTLVIETDVENVQLSIHRLTHDSSEGSRRQFKWRYPGITTTGSQSITLRSGAYVVFLRDAKQAPHADTNSGRVSDNLANRRLALSQSRFVIGRGGEVIIKVTRNELPRGVPTNTNSISAIRQFGLHGKQINTLAVDANGERVVTAAEDDAVRVWEIASGRELLRIDRETSGNRQDADISPDGRFIALGGGWEDGNIEIWELDTRRKVQDIDAPKKSSLVVAFSPDGKILASGGKGRSVWLWDVKSGQKRLELKGHRDTVCTLDFSPDGNAVLSGSFDESIRLWEVAQGELLREFSGIGRHVRRIAFSPDGRYFTASTYIPTFFLYDIEKEQPIRMFSGHAEKPSCLVFSPDSRYVISGSPDKTLRVWETRSAREVARVTSETHSNNLVAIVPNTSHVLTAGGWDMDNPTRSGDGDYSIHVKRLPKAILPHVGGGIREVAGFEGHGKHVSSLDVSQDGKSIVSGSADGTMRVWDADTRRILHTFTDHRKDFEVHVAISPDGKRVASGDWNGRIRIWNLGTDAPIVDLTSQHRRGIYQVAFSLDGTKLLTAGNDAAARLWDAQTGEELQVFGGHGSWVSDAAISEPSDRVATVSFDETVRLWSMKTGKELFRLPTNRRAAFCIAFSPDGSLLAAGFRNGTIRLYDTKKGVEVGSLLGHTERVRDVAFSPDGKLLLSGCWDKTLRIWNVETLREVAQTEHQHHVFNTLAMTPGGRHVLAGGGIWKPVQEKNDWVTEDDYAIRLWRLPASAWTKADLGENDYALDFDGRKSYVETPIRYDGSHALTIEAFVTPRVVSDENQVLVGDSQASGLALMLRDDGFWHFGIWDKRRRNYVRVQSENPAVADRRVHLAGIINQNQVRLFVDGELQGEPADLGEVVPSGLPMMIGANWEPGNRFWEHFAGVMDEVRISKVARYDVAGFTPQARFQADKDTLALYHFDEGSGNTVKDSSGNSRHGIVADGKWVSPAP